MRLFCKGGPAQGGAALFLAALLVAPGSAVARELSIDATPCASTVRIAARDVPLEDVVSGLAKAMEVRLVAKTALPEPVTFTGSGAPEELLKRLLHGKNLVVETQRKAACGPREVLATVWLLPVGEERARDAAAAPSGHDGKSRPRGDRQGRHPMSDEERRRMKKEWQERQLERARAGDVGSDPAEGESPPHGARTDR